MRFLVLLGCCLCFAGKVSADDWPSAPPRVFSSEDGEQSIKVVPILRGANAGQSSATLFELGGEGKQKAQPEFALINTPMRVLVPTRWVKFFVTLDTWAQVGRGHVVVIYNHEGRVLYDLELSDLLTPEEQRQHVTRSVSSSWWRNDATFSFETPGTHKGILFTSHFEKTRLNIAFKWGKKISIELATGKVENAA